MRSASRIGVLGGSFDPPHIAHCAIAELAAEQFRLDRVIFVPAFLPPHKSRRARAEAAARLAMTKLAARGNRLLTVSDVEVRRGGISYTVDTLRELRRRFRTAKLFLIIGADNLRGFNTWKSPKEITRLATLLVYGRPGFRMPSQRPIHYRLIKGPLFHLSSTDIRNRIAEGKSVRYFVPEPVHAFIMRRQLYRK